MSDVIVAILGSSAIAAIITKVLDIVSENKKGTSLVEKGVMSLLGMQLRNSCEKAIKDNCIDLENLRQIQDMNALYHSMGGNGYVRTLMDRVEHLPISEE